MTTISTGGGLDVGALFNKAFDKVNEQGANLTKQMETLNANDNQAMLKMQFMVGQYNAMLEATSSVTKSLVDEAKQMASRTG